MFVAYFLKMVEAYLFPTPNLLRAVPKSILLFFPSLLQHALRFFLLRANDIVLIIIQRPLFFQQLLTVLFKKLTHKTLSFSNVKKKRRHAIIACRL
jgi:hypothetical protein